MTISSAISFLLAGGVAPGSDWQHAPARPTYARRERLSIIVQSNRRATIRKNFRKFFRTVSK
jgi:hypothetical protein